MRYVIALALLIAAATPAVAQSANIRCRQAADTAFVDNSPTNPCYVAPAPGSPFASDLEEVGGAAISLGQKPAATSLPVTIASDQPAIPVTATPAGVTGFGTLAVTAVNTLVAGITIGPNSAAWPASPGTVYVMNDVASAGNVYVCPKGGTCSASVGLELVPGRSWGFYQPATTMTVFATSTATVQAQW